MRATLLALALAFSGPCNPVVANPPPGPIPIGDDDDDSAPVTAPAPAPGVDALRACLDNFEALNPGVPEQQIQDTFCSTDADLAPFKAARKKP